MHKLFVSALLGSAFLFPMVSNAEGSYLKVGVGESTYAGVPVTTGVSIDSSRTATAGFIAYGRTIAPNISGEIGYIDFGASDAKLSFPAQGLTITDQLRTRSIYLAGIGDVPITSSVSFQGKLGMVMHHTNTQLTVTFLGEAASAESSYRKTRALVGAGLKAQFSKEISGVVDYTYFGTTVDGTELALLSAGLLFHF
jgi:hypothetical protein